MELLTGLSTICAVVALVASIAALRIAGHAVQCADAALDLAKEKASEYTRTEAADFQTQLADQDLQLDNIRKTLRRMSARLSMRKNREENLNGTGEPDSVRDPQAWKAWQRQQLQRK